jgi:hypothetical protein
MKNKVLKEMNIKLRGGDVLDDLLFQNEYELVYKLINLSVTNWNFSKNIYFSSNNYKLKCNYLVCFFDKFDFFFNFREFDLFFFYSF